MGSAPDQPQNCPYNYIDRLDRKLSSELSVGRVDSRVGKSGRVQIFAKFCGSDRVEVVYIKKNSAQYMYRNNVKMLIKKIQRYYTDAVC